MQKMRVADFKQLAEYLSASTTQPIVEGILKDIAENFPQSKASKELVVEQYVLGARARPSDMDVFVVICRRGRSEMRLSYLVKLVHHFLEADRSADASRLQLGPPIVAVDDNRICERFFDREDSWRIKAGKLDIETAKYLGIRLAEKISLMFTVKLFHRFDDFPEHTFILYSHADTDIRWIDWGRGFSLESAGRVADFLARSWVSVVLENLRKVTHSILAYLAFRKAIRKNDTKSLYLSELVKDAERVLTSVDSTFSSQWNDFLAAVDATNKNGKLST